MRKRSHLVGFVLLLVILLSPNSAVASPGAVERHTSVFSEMLGRLAELVTDLLAPAEDEADGRCGIDPWGCPAGNNGDLGPGIDPWG